MPPLPTVSGGFELARFLHLFQQVQRGTEKATEKVA
jgi:hypothetical protein